MKKLRVSPSSLDTIVAVALSDLICAIACRLFFVDME